MNAPNISQFTSQSVMGNISYTIKICAVIAVIGLIIKFTVSSYEASILGLALVALSLFCSMIMVLKYYYSTGSEDSFFNGAVLPSLVQLILICAIVGVLLYQTLTTSQNVTSSEYTTFSSISAMLALMQICITFYYLFLNMKCLKGNTCDISERDSITSLGIMYLNIILTLLNVCALGIIQVILNKFYIC